MIGTTIANYRITTELGAGGMGVVYKATDLMLDRTVALKFLGPAYSEDAVAKARFIHEAKAASALDHPNICTIHGIEEAADGRLFIVMACYEGRTLKELIARGPLAVHEAADIALQVAQGLAKAHRFGIVHRDIKPANVFVTGDGLVKLLDFGISKLVGLTQLTRTGTTMGTAHYMSPEQLLGKDADRRADVWSLGVVLYEMLAGRLPFTGESAAAVAYAITHREPVPLDEMVPGLPPEVIRAVAGCLRKDSAERYPGVEPLLQLLQPWAGVADATVALERTAGRRLQADALAANPYPGLASFTEKDTEYFHGRESQVEAVWQKLRRGRLLAVAGPSGVGKTSFLRAGLVAAKPRDWGVLLVTPGGAPFRAVREALVRELSGDTEALVSLFREDDPDTDVAAISRWRRGHGEAVLIIDQFEELFTLSRPEEQARFAELLSRLTFEADLRVLVSLRDDFLHHCREHAGLTPVFESLTMLGPLSGPSLRRALMQPAHDCGYRFEDESLVDEMMTQVEGERGALPLLAFAMAGLWAGRDRTRGLLTRQAYEQLGEVCGALAQHAEAVMERIGEQRHALVRELFRNLMTGHGTRAVVEREQLLSVFVATDREAAGQVLGQLIDARLLTSYEVKAEDGRGCHRLEIIHESLLSAWPRLVRWRTQEADGAQLRDQLRQAAQLWKERHESTDLLWTGMAYREFALWRERYPGGLTGNEAAFAQAMAARARRDRRRRRLAVGAAFVLLLGILAVIGWSWRGEKRARHSAEASELVALGRAELDGNPTAALAYAIASLERFDSPANRLFALEALARGPIAFVRPYGEGLADGIFVDFSPNGEHLAIGGNAGVQVLSHDESPAVVLDDDWTGWARQPLFAPDGDRVIWRDTRDASLVHVWSLAAGREVRTLDMDSGVLVAMTKEHLILLTAVKDSARPGASAVFLRTWPFGDGDPELVGSWNTDRFAWFYPDPDGRAIAYTLRQGRGIYYGSLAEFVGFRGRLLGEHDRTAYYPMFDPTGQRVASADSSGEIRIWSVAGAGQEPLRVLRGEGPIHSLRFDPSGTRLAAVCGPRRTVCIWHLDGPRDSEPVSLRFEYQNRNFNFVAFDPSGRWLVESDLKQVVFWPVGSPDQYTLPGSPLGFLPDGRSLVSLGIARQGPGTWTHSMWIADLRGGAARQLASGPGAASAAMDPQGRFVAVAAGDLGVYLVPLAKSAVTKRWLPNDPPGGGFGVVAVSADGSLVAKCDLGQQEARLRLWKLEPDTVRVLWTSTCRNLPTLAFSPDGRLYSGDDEGNIHEWNLDDGNCKLVDNGSLSTSWGLVVTPDSRHLISLRSQAETLDPMMTSELAVVDLESRTSRPITGHGNKVSALAADATGTRLVTGDADGIVRVGPVTGEDPHLLLGQHGVLTTVVSPDGRWIASSGAFDPDRELTQCLWRVPEGRPLQTLPHGALLDHLRAQTNLRVVPDRGSATGYRVEAGPFAGW